MISLGGEAMNVRLAPEEWAGLLEAAREVARQWDEEEAGRPDSRSEFVREQVELEISTLELLHALRQNHDRLIEAPEEFARPLSDLLSAPG